MLRFFSRDNGQHGWKVYRDARPGYHYTAFGLHGSAFGFADTEDEAREKAIAAMRRLTKETPQ